MREKIVLIGAGSAMFTRGLISDLLKKKWGCELGLVDTNEKSLKVAEKLARKMIDHQHADIRLTVSVDRREVLSEATVVIATIGVGGRRSWELDYQIPRKYGIFQPVGDSVMAGGASRALRMIPAMIAIAEERLRSRKVNDLAGKHFDEDGSSVRPPEQEVIMPDPFTWQLLKTFNAYPSVMDRHVTEFFPHLFGKEKSYFGKTLGTEVFNLDNTIAWGDRIFEEMEDLALSQDPLPDDFFAKLEGEHEQVIDIIDSIRDDRGTVYSANVPNRGQVGNFPLDSIVECPVLAWAGGLRPVWLGRVSAGIAALMARQFQWVELIVEAAVEGNRQKFVQVLFLDGCLDSIDVVEQMAEDLLQAQRDYLPQFRL